MKLIFYLKYQINNSIDNGLVFPAVICLAVPKSPPPRKTPFSDRREREFLYLHEVDAVIAACQNTRNPIRNQALAVLLFCQCLQPSELCWLRWCDVNEDLQSLLVTRNRSKSTRQSQQIVTNLQPLCPKEVELLEQLKQVRTTDWIFASERKQRLSERSLHHIIQQAGEIASLPNTTHPYMLRRSGLYYRSALLLQATALSLSQCCLLWNWHATNTPLSAQNEQKYYSISSAQKSAFFQTLDQIKVFSGITLYQNTIDYLLGAFSLEPQLQDIPQDYWLSPINWQPQTLPKRLQLLKSRNSNEKSRRF